MRNDMANQTRVGQPSYNLLPTDIEGVELLAELALDMRWSWNHATDYVWRQLDPAGPPVAARHLSYRSGSAPWG
jgi:hypothetical protein